MKFYKVLLIALLMFCTVGVCAADEGNVFGKGEKYFTGVLYKNASGDVYFIVGNVINSPVSLLRKVTSQDVPVLWEGKGYAVDGKVIWIDEEVPQMMVERKEPGIATNNLKSFLDGQGSKIKERYFSTNTEYFASNAENKYMTESLKMVQILRKRSDMDAVQVITMNLSDLLDKYTEYTKNKAEKEASLTRMKNGAQKLLGIYEVGVLISPELNLDAYKKVKPYLEKIANSEVPMDDYNTYKVFANKSYRLVMALTSDRDAISKAVLDQVLVISAEKTLQEIFDELKNTEKVDAKKLLGENGLLTIALNKANSEMTSKQNPNVEICYKIKEKCLTLMLVLKDRDKSADIQSVATRHDILADNIKNYRDRMMEKADKETTLDKILEKKMLGDEEYYGLFGGKKGCVATVIINEYNRDPQNPLNAIRVLIVEGLRRHLEAMSNEINLSGLISYEIMDGDFFKIDSETYKAMKSVVDKLKVEELKARNDAERESLDKYKADLKLVGKFELK
jgi:hypothetical protein